MTDTASESNLRHAQGPGRLLREAREQLRVSVEDLSAQVKLSRATIDALERDDFGQLSETVYVRGYYRKLAKVLPVSEADLLKAYESQVTPKAPPPPSKLILAGGQELGSGARINFKLAGLVVVTAFSLAAIAFLAKNRLESSAAPVVTAAPVEVNPSAEGKPTPDSKPVASAPAEAKPVTAAPSSGHMTEAAPGTTPEQQMLTPPPAGSESGNLTPAESAMPAPNTAVPAASAGDATLELAFTGTCWTEVKDVHGRTLLSGVMPSGASRSVQGAAPLSVFLGNAPSAQLVFNGSKVDISTYIRSNSNTARFKLP